MVAMYQSQSQQQRPSVLDVDIHLDGWVRATSGGMSWVFEKALSSLLLRGFLCQQCLSSASSSIRKASGSVVGDPVHGRSVRLRICLRGKVGIHGDAWMLASMMSGVLKSTHPLLAGLVPRLVRVPEKKEERRRLPAFARERKRYRSSFGCLVTSHDGVPRGSIFNGGQTCHDPDQWIPYGLTGISQPFVMALVVICVAVCLPPIDDLRARLGSFGPR